MSDPCTGGTDHSGNSNVAVHVGHLLVTQFGHNRTICIQQDSLGSVSKYGFSSRGTSSTADDKESWVDVGSLAQYLISNVPDASPWFDYRSIKIINSLLNKLFCNPFCTLYFLSERKILKARNLLERLAVRFVVFLGNDVQSDEGVIIRSCEIVGNCYDLFGPFVLVNCSEYRHITLKILDPEVNSGERDYQLWIIRDIVISSVAGDVEVKRCSLQAGTEQGGLE